MHVLDYSLFSSTGKYKEGHADLYRGNYLYSDQRTTNEREKRVHYIILYAIDELNNLKYSNNAADR